MEMEILKCKHCGAELDIRTAVDGVITCEYCNVQLILPKDDTLPEAQKYLHDGESRLYVGEFDKAYDFYKKAAELAPGEPEAHFGMALAKFNVRYLSDKVNDRLQPICGKVTTDLFTMDGDYQRALDLADTQAKSKLYAKRAEEIDYIRGEFYRLRSQGIRYDCFICVKVNDDNENKTADYKIADDIYFSLKENGYKPFFSERELTKFTGADYEARILYALYESECMLLVCGNEEYLQTKWVKNEYTRFLRLINDEEKESDSIAMVYTGRPIQYLPGKRGKIQGIDIKNLNAMSRINGFVEKHTPEYHRKKEEEQRKKEEENAKQTEFLRKLEEYERKKREEEEETKRQLAEAQKRAKEADLRAWKLQQERIRLEEIAREDERIRRAAQEAADRERRAIAERARKEAEERARREAEEAERARREAEERARREAEEAERARRAAEERARKAAEERAKREAEEKARKEAEERARLEAEERERKEAEERARKEEEERIREEKERARKEAEERKRIELERIQREKEEIARQIEEEKQKRIAEIQKRKEAEKEFDIDGDVIKRYKGSGGAVVIPDFIREIGEKAFMDCRRVTSITVSESVERIKDHAFENCVFVKEIKFNATKCNNMGAFNKVFFNVGRNAGGINIIIGKNVTQIPDNMFCSIGNSSKIVEIIFEEGAVCERIGEKAFSDCKGFTKITLPENIKTICNHAFDNCVDLMEINFNAISCGDFDSKHSVFNNIGKASGQGVTVNVGKTVKRIPAHMFNFSYGITKVQFAEGSVCESVGKQAFNSCSNLKVVVLPESVKKLGVFAFSAFTKVKRGGEQNKDEKSPLKWFTRK